MRKLRVSQNHHFLIYEDGALFPWFGDTAWELFHRATREDAERYLYKRSSQGFSVVQAVVLAEEDGIRTPNAYGHLPLIDEDPTKPNEDYFRHVDWIIGKANSLGIFPGILPTWGDKVGHTHGIGPKIFTEGNAKVYGNFLGERYREADLIWIIGGDRTVDDTEQFAIWRALAAGLRAGDHGNHLLTFHPRGGDDLVSTSSLPFPNSDPLLDFNMRQNGHCDTTKTWARISADYEKTPTKPVLDGEPLYEDHPICFRSVDHGYSNAHDIRRFLYWDLFAGGFGHTYGHHSVWQMHDPARGEGVNLPISFWYDAIDSPGANQVRHARALLESRPFLTRIPDNSLIAVTTVRNSVPGSGTKYLNATRAADGSYGMVYLAASRTFVLDPAELSGETLHFWWFDPRTGTNVDLGTFPRAWRFEITPPLVGENVDWILVCDDAAKGYPTPGFGEIRRQADNGRIGTQAKTLG
ncbi:MAG: glycoside hydrolase family 140 protein [Verrucomicrobia bacterium]|nr:glycoside hydrolase family 140 protein [Verrucomicrobiota bacterium]